MSQSKLQIDPERVRDLVLVRVLLTRKKPINLSQLLKELGPELSAQLSAADAKQALMAAVQDAEGGALLTLANPPKGKVPRPVLTDSGRQRALSALGVKALPPKLAWPQARRLFAMQVLAPAKLLSQKIDADAIATQILIAKHALPSSVSTLTQAVERLAWRALDVETDAPFTAAAVQRHLLRHIVPSDTRAKGEVWRRMLAMRAVHAQGHNADALARALLALDGPLAAEARAADASAQHKRPSISNDNAPPRLAQPSLAEFAVAVRQAATNPQVRRFHGDRAFIGSVWEHMRASQMIGEMSLEEFKAKLVSAHRERLLEIVRADLVGAMDPNEVRRSEARHDNATYHFVALNAGGL